MSIRLKDTIYNTANYASDSDKLDGYDSSHYMQYKSASTPATAQWYRIAQTGSGISNNIGIFEIYGSTSGYHTDVILEAGTSYGNTAGTTLVQTSCAAFSSQNLTKARIVYHTTYNGNYAYLEVYLNCSAATTIYVKFQGHGWTLVAPSTVGSIPSGYSTKEITFTKDAVVAKTFVGALSGNASTATSATSATTATSAGKLTTARTISLTGSVTGSGSFDGSGNLSIATTTNHSHSYASKVTVGSTAYSVSSNNITIPAYPTSLKCPNSLTIQGNGTNLDSYDGSAAKTINITPAAIGAAASGHTHDYAANYQKTCTVSNTNGSSAWYTILSVGDSTNSPVLVSVRAYAHSSITFIACKGYSTSGSINVLNYCASGNGSYPYVKGVRLLSDGKVQVYLNSPTTLSGDKKIQVNVFCTGSVTITTTLTYETGSPTVIAEPTLNDRGISTLGNITAAKFVKSGSSDSYLLLGAGGSKAVSDFATSGHTHNYAGSSSAGGAATSANKLATARKITLSGSVTGSADFDGSAAITISTTTNHTHSYAGSSSAGGAATSANKLNTNAGGATTPVYFTGGVPTACSVASSAATASTIAVRDGSGDIYARLIRQTYADQSTISGGIVYRVNNSSDNYLRVCNSASAIRSFLGVPSTSDLGAYLPRRRMTNPDPGHANVGAIPLILALKSAGTPVYGDPEFKDGNNSVAVYNNSGNGTVTITRIDDNQNSANSSGKILQISTTTGTASPGRGGFYQSISARAGAVFCQIFRAKIPTGFSVVNAENSMGDNYKTYWMTDTAGTGKWEWYCRITSCGTSGTMSGGGHVYLSGSGAVTWYLSYCNLIDLTKGNKDGLRSVYADQANKLGSNAGSATQPIYFTNGVPTACTYTLGKSVPSDAKFTDTNTTYSTATSSTLGLVKIGYTQSGKNYPVQLSNGQMYVNVPWTDTNTDTNTWRGITDSYSGTDSTISLSQKGGKALYDALVNGYASSAGTATSLYTGSASGTSHANALQTYFNSNKSSIPRNKAVSFYSSAYSNGSQYMGYFLSGYDTTPYGGFFCAHYDNCYYVGISYGTFNEQRILTSSNWSSYCAAASHTHSYAASSHNHDSVYSKLGHTHSYAASSHTHNYAGSSSAGGDANNSIKWGGYKIVVGSTGTATDTIYFVT